MEKETKMAIHITVSVSKHMTFKFQFNGKLSFESAFIFDAINKIQKKKKMNENKNKNMTLITMSIIKVDFIICLMTDRIFTPSQQVVCLQKQTFIGSKNTLFFLMNYLRLFNNTVVFSRFTYLKVLILVVCY